MLNSDEVSFNEQFQIKKGQVVIFTRMIDSSVDSECAFKYAYIAMQDFDRREQIKLFKQSRLYDKKWNRKDYENMENFIKFLVKKKMIDISAFYEIVFY